MYHISIFTKKIILLFSILLCAGVIFAGVSNIAYGAAVNDVSCQTSDLGIQCTGEYECTVVSSGSLGCGIEFAWGEYANGGPYEGISDYDGTDQYTESHTYASAGTYTIEFNVDDDEGFASWSDSYTMEDSNTDPFASFTYTTSDLTANFDAGDSYDSDGSISSYSWDFGDGNTGSGETPSHTYSSGGTYNVTLTVTDNDGGTRSTNSDVSVSAPNTAPTANFSYSADGLQVDFTDQSSDSDGSISSWSWYLGSGEGNSSQQNPTHTYSAPGSYYVQLNVEDDDGATDFYQETITVEESNTAPNADFSYSKNDLCVDFTDQSSDADGSISAHSWSFGDGGGSSSADPSNCYGSGGSYSVELTVTDDDGATDTRTQDVTVSESNTAPNASFSISPNPVAEGESFTLDAGASSDAEDSDSQLTYEWDFASDDFPGVNDNGEVVTNSINNFPSDNRRAMTLTVTDTGGLSDSDTQYVTEKVTTTFSADDTSITEGEDVTLTWGSTGADSCSGTNFSTGGNTSGSRTLSPTSDTTYELTCSNSQNNSNQSINVNVSEANNDPTASFNASVSDLTVTLDASGSSDDGSITEWRWDLGDGSSHNDNDPYYSYTYGSANTYTINLEVVDNEGATDSTSQGVTVTEPNDSPNASFSYSADDLTVDFDASGSSDPDGDPLTYNWDFGDSKTGTGETVSHTYDSGGTYTVELTVTDDSGASDTTTRNVSPADGRTITGFNREEI